MSKVDVKWHAGHRMPPSSGLAFGSPLKANVEVAAMEYDQRKIEEVVIALLGALEFENGRVWKRFDFAIMDALHEKGLITDPKGHHESVYLTEEGKVLAKQLAAKFFAIGSGSGS